MSRQLEPGLVLPGAEALNGEPPVDNFVVYPYSSNAELDNRSTQLVSFLGVASLAAITATAEAWHRNGNPNAKIIIPGETPFEDLPNTTTLMMERAKELGVPEEALIGLNALKNGRYLNNTYLQSEALSEYFEGSIDEGRTVVLALRYHLDRVIDALRKRGMHPEFTTVEDVLSVTGNNEYDDLLPVFSEGLRPSERIAKLITRFTGRKGWVPNLIVRFKGARIVDLEGEVEKPKLVNNYAKKTLTKLRKEQLRREAAQAAMSAEPA